MSARERDFEVPPEVQAAFDAVVRTQAESAEREKAFAVRTAELSGVPQAEAWLAFQATEPTADYCVEEAVTYLASRGLDVELAVDMITKRWKRDIQNAIDHHVIYRADLPDGAGEDARRQPLPIDTLGSFWPRSGPQELHIDAALLRVAEACRIGGFGEWWGRYYRAERASALRDGVESSIPLSYWLAAMARSSLARREMGSVLAQQLAAIELDGEYLSGEPWRFAFVPGRGVGAPYLRHYGVTANLAFCAPLVTGEPSEVSMRAAELLLEKQAGNGGWLTFDNDESPGLQTSATAIHGLVWNRPHGWERAVRRCAAWLKDQAREIGCWVENACPDPHFLTVLVLDAIALADDPQATTTITGPSTFGQAGRAGSGRRFSIGLSFPGEARDVAQDIAERAGAVVGRERVLYDRFHSAEFARPDLDTHLQRLYKDDCDLLVVFIGKRYGEKTWPGLEWRAIRQLVIGRESERVLLVRLDDGDVPGIFPTDGYLDSRLHGPAELASAVLERHRALTS